jgi:hypothetical protein
VRGRRLHSTVDLRGLPRGRFVVRIIARTRGGRKLISRRVYHTCVPHRPGRRGSRQRTGLKPGAS